MDRSPVDLLSSLLEFERSEVSGRDDYTETEDRVAYDLLQRAGALIPAGLVDTIICQACETPHHVAIEFVPGGSYRAYCADTGWQGIDPDAVVRYAVDQGWVEGRIREGVGIPADRVMASPSSSFTRIGTARFGPYRTDLFFARRLADRQRFEEVVAAVTGVIGDIAAVIITSTAGDLTPSKAPGRCALVELRHAFRIEADGTSSVDSAPFLSALRGQITAVQGAGIGSVISRGYRSATWNGKQFKFTNKQALVIEALYEAHRNGLRGQHQIELQGAAETSQRMSELFRQHRAYGDLIRNDGEGFYWLDL